MDESHFLNPFLISLCMIRQAICLLLICVSAISCSDKYQSHVSEYQFTSEGGKPVYASLDYWAAHPWKGDPSDSISQPLLHEIKDSLADVFFLHPTTYTSKRKIKKPNASIDDDYINAKTDYSSILYQASVFNGSCKVFAPRYRQAHISNFYKQDKKGADSAFAIAYADIKEAFEYYIQHWNNGRPIIIAAHSQGSFLAEHLLKEFFEDTSSYSASLKNKLVVAYILGWPVPKDYFSSLEICKDSLQTGCICSWRTLRKGYLPDYLRNEKGSSFVTNPLTWTTATNYASRKLNKGSVLTKFNKVYKHTTDAQISNGILYVHKPKFPWGFLYTTKNYHIGDINLYYLNIRENVKQRIQKFKNK